jgi:hypothetical protein
MTVQEIMADLQSLGSESIKKVLLKHGVKEPFFGVKIEYLKPIQKKIKKDYQLAKDLYATGNADAMYLAGLIADDGKMTKADLQTWAQQAVSDNIIKYTVPWVAAEGNYGFEMALQWIDSADEHIAVTGWATLSNLVALKPDDELDMPELKRLLQRVVQNIHLSDNQVIATMNGFIIAVGSHVSGLTDDALTASSQIGKVTVDKHGAACKTPGAAEYIMKAKDKGAIGKKKKTVKC